MTETKTCKDVQAMEDFDKSLRQYAESQGEDYDALLSAVYKVIQRGKLQPRTTPLTEDEIRDLVEDDLRAMPLENDSSETQRQAFYFCGVEINGSLYVRYEGNTYRVDTSVKYNLETAASRIVESVTTEVE